MRTDSVNILLVDDQPAKLVMYDAVLQDLGENLLKAGSAREALDCLLKNDIAVVLVDVCMPDLDGYELAGLIRQHPRFQKTAIIFVSAMLINDLDRLRGYECGGVDFVPVPVVPEILRAKVSVFAELHRKTRELEALNRELEARVTERTSALEATTSALQESSHRKDEFLAMLAHELRNPLAPIRTAAHLLKLNGLSESQRERSRQVIERQVDHLVRLIDDLLDVSRINRGIITLRQEEIDIADPVARAIETTRPIIDHRAIEFTVHMPDERLTVYGDATRLAQALSNLLNNAAKFTETGGKVHLLIERDGGDAVIRVRDTGIGIPRDMLPKIFDLFVQVNRGVGLAQGGLGLGLALVRRLIEMHGGSVEAFSDGPDSGTEMVVRLPFCQPARVELPLASPPPSAERESLQPRRILIVDDNKDAAETIGMLLRSEGHDIRIAYDGLDALNVGSTFAPEVVLMDLGMPNLDGHAAAQRIRDEPWGKDTLLVALTGWGQPSDRQRSAESGFDLHIVKPVDGQGLYSILSRLSKANAEP